MKTNESNLDRIVRVVLGIIMLVLYFAGIVSGTLGIIALILGILLTLTGLVGFCPLYTLLKISTKNN